MGTYWNGDGKYQNFVNKMQNRVPHYGMTENRYLNAFLTVSNLYYDYYNNGGGNVADGIYTPKARQWLDPLFDGNHFVVDMFCNGTDEGVEDSINSVLERLMRVDDGELHCPIYTLWSSNKLNAISAESQALAHPGDEWFSITFGLREEYMKWAKERIANFRHTVVGREITMPDPIIAVFPLGDNIAQIAKSGDDYVMTLRRDNEETVAAKFSYNERKLDGTSFGRPILQLPYDDNVHWRSEELRSPASLPDVVQRENGTLYCRKCGAEVQNTANNEMRKEGCFAHSHTCPEN